ncbi:MAG: hypothetical protein SO253_00830 [Bacilli bacterium]|nr:hypothetical protein [Bacilli bacterium]
MIYIFADGKNGKKLSKINKNSNSVQTASLAIDEKINNLVSGVVFFKRPLNQAIRKPLQIRQSEKGETHLSRRKITAMYERLRRDDDQQGESNSIANQKRLLASYVAQYGKEQAELKADNQMLGGSP